MEGAALRSSSVAVVEVEEPLPRKGFAADWHKDLNHITLMVPVLVPVEPIPEHLPAPQAGLPVPPGCVLSPEACAAFLAAQHVSPTHSPDAIRQALRTAPLPAARPADQRARRGRSEPPVTTRATSTAEPPAARG